MKNFPEFYMNNISYSIFSLQKKSIVAFGFTFLVVLISVLNQRQMMADMVSILFIYCAALYGVVYWRPIIVPTFMVKCYWFLLTVAVLSSVNFIFREDNYSNIKVISSLYPFILVLLYYHFFQTRRLLSHHLIPVVLFLLFFGSIMAYQNSLSFADIITRQARTNWANLVGACVPTLFLIKGRALRIIMVIAVNVVMAVALKRTGILIGFFSVFIILFFDRESYNNSYKYINGLVKLTIALLIGWAGFISKNFETGIHRLSRLASDGGAGRVGFLSEGWGEYLDWPTIDKIMGTGYQAFKVVSEKHFSTHNDLMDFLLSYGLLGAIFLTCVYLRLGYICYSFRKSNMFDYALVTTFVFTMYSGAASIHHYFYFFSPVFINVAYLEFLYAKRFIRRV